MPSLTLDPFVLAAPLESREAIERFVTNLLGWSALQREPWVTLLLSSRACECLFEDGCYPLHTPLRHAFAAHGIDHIDVRDVTSLANFLMAQTPSLEEYHGVNDVLFDPLDIDPNVAARRPGGRLLAETIRSLTLIGFAGCHKPEWFTNARFATREVQSPSGAVRISGSVQHADVTAAALGRHPKPAIGRHLKTGHRG
jgi:hypothetical protein